MVLSRFVLDPILHLLPLWLVGILIIMACLLAREAGAYIYRRMAARRSASAKGESGNAGALSSIGVILGLLALAVGLAF